MLPVNCDIQKDPDYSVTDDHIQTSLQNEREKERVREIGSRSGYVESQHDMGNYEISKL